MASSPYPAALRILMHFLLSTALIAAFILVLLDWGTGYLHLSDPSTNSNGTATTNPSPRANPTNR